MPSPRRSRLSIWTNMSTSDTSPPTTPAQPNTPPPPSPSVRVTLPTPPSFSARRMRSASITPVPPENKKGHHRSVSFTLEPEPSPASIDTNTDTNTNTKVYRIPQRTSSQDVPTPLSATRQPPRPLDLASRPVPAGPLSVSPLTRTTRYGSTAAAKGLSITPALPNKRHSTSGASGSIWSAGLTGPGIAGAAGWISPALNSARSVGTSTRQRGLTVAVLKDGKELLIGDVPVTPGLSTGGGLRSAGSVIGSAPARGLSIPEDNENEGDDQPRRKEVILCRYYHTPGLTCTSRPCRFVHNLDTLKLHSPRDIETYPMKSPHSSDPTSGTFADAQMQAHAKRLNIDELVSNGAAPGETVVLANENGKEVVGTVFLMSGGGKGPAGKSKAKFKTVPCKDFAEGYCPYGDYCSFMHNEKLPMPSTPATIKNDVPEKEGDSQEDSSPNRRYSTGSAPSSALTAWTKALPRAVLVPSMKVDPGVLDKQKRRLSAFAAPYLETPLEVGEKGNLIIKTSSPDLPLSPRQENTLPLYPPLVDKGSSDSVLKRSADLSRVRGPPPTLKKVSIMEPKSDDRPSPRHLAPPISALSAFGTESDPATPWDPALRKKVLAELSEDSISEHTNPLAKAPSYPSPTEFPPSLWPTPSYPWGMPMSPITPLGQTDYPSIPGGPGVMWTPAGWAVQDAAMKHSLRKAELKTQHNYVKAKTGKTYYKTRLCRFFAEGHCPHGDSCTYLHSLPSSSGSENDEKEKYRSPNHKTLPCKFYNSASGCNNGADCAFLHTFVVPASVPLVEKPRPWRTRPCRHFQLNRCTLGDACHFAHVLDPSHKCLDRFDKPCRHWQKGHCEKGDECKFAHSNHESRLRYDDEQITEIRLARAFEEMRGRLRQRQEESDGEDDDVEIVTTATMSPVTSGRCDY